MAHPALQIRWQPEEALWGLWCRCTPATAGHSAQALASAYGKAAPRGERPAFPFYLLARGRGGPEEEYDLFAGGTRPGEALGEYRLPAGWYASLPVSPRWGIGAFWNRSLEEARKELLEELPRLGCRPLGLEYQLHGEESLRRPPVVRLVVAVAREGEPLP